MKLLIIAIILLFSSATLAQEPEQLQWDRSSPEFAEFIQLNINRGLTADIRIYTAYLTSIYNYGTFLENIFISMRYSSCSIMWRNVLESIQETKELNHKMISSAIYRSIEMAKWFVIRLGEDPNKVESGMIPMIAAEIGARKAMISESIVYSCTALDVAGFQQLSANGHLVEPLEDWILEPIPEFKEPAIPSTSSALSNILTYL